MNVYRKLFFMNFFLNLNTLIPIITLFYFHRGLDIFDVFILNVVYAVTIVLAEVPTGMIGDKWGQKTAIVLGTISTAINGAIFIFAEGVVMFSVAFSLFTLSNAFMSGAVEAYIYENLLREKKQKLMNEKMGKFMSARALTGIFMPIISTLVAKDLSAGQFMFLVVVNLISVLIACGFAFSLPNVKSKQKKDSIAMIRKAITLLKNNKIFFRLSFNKILAYSLVLAYWRIWQPYFKEDLMIPVIVFGFLVAGVNLLYYFMLKQIKWIEEEIGIVWALRIFAYMPIAAAIVFFFTQNIFVHMGIYVVMMSTVFFRDNLFSRYMNGHIPSENRATTLSLINWIRNVIEIPLSLFLGYVSSIWLPYALIPPIFLALIGVTIFRIKGNEFDNFELIESKNGK